MFARRLGVSTNTVTIWRRRYRAEGLTVVPTRARSGRPKTITAAKEQAVVAATMKSPKVETHWSARRLAKQVGLSHATVHRGKVHGRCYSRHTHVEFIELLRSVAKRSSRREIHVICDNYGTHKHPKVRDWLKEHPRFHLHFTPTSASWLNLVERWFALVTTQVIRRGSFDSVQHLERAIRKYLEAWNDDANPFTGRRVRGRSARRSTPRVLVRQDTSVCT